MKSATAGKEPSRCEVAHVTESLNTVALTGELDVANAAEVRRSIDQHLAGSTTTVVDLREVTFLDSVILSVLISAARRAKESGGTLELTGLRPAVRRVFSITGVDNVVTIRD